MHDTDGDQFCAKGIRTAAGSAAATARSLAGEHWWHCGPGVLLLVLSS